MFSKVGDLAGDAVDAAAAAAADTANSIYDTIFPRFLRYYFSRAGDKMDNAIRKAEHTPAIRVVKLIHLSTISTKRSDIRHFRHF